MDILTMCGNITISAHNIVFNNKSNLKVDNS